MKEIQRRALDPEDEHHDPALLRAVGEAVINQDYTRLEDLLNVPAKTLEATIRKERRKIALALLPQAQRHYLEFAPRYQRILDRAVQVLERHWVDNPMWLETMSPKVAMETVKALAPVLNKLYGGVALDSVRLEIEEKKTGIDAGNFLEAIREISQARKAHRNLPPEDAAFEIEPE